MRLSLHLSQGTFSAKIQFENRTHLISRIFFSGSQSNGARKLKPARGEFDCIILPINLSKHELILARLCFWCVENSAQTTLPSIAVTMAAPSALAQRINLFTRRRCDRFHRLRNLIFWSNVGHFFALAGFDSACSQPAASVSPMPSQHLQRKKIQSKQNQSSVLLQKSRSSIRWRRNQMPR